MLPLFIDDATVAVADDILNGHLPLPHQQLFSDKLTEEQYDLVTRLWNALWHNFLVSEGSVNSTHWYDRFADPKLFNKVIIKLDDWVVSRAIPARNWAEISLNVDKLLDYVSYDDLLQVRATYKVDKYLMTSQRSKHTDLVKQNGKTKRTGLVREGFCKAGNTQFGYDVAKLSKYRTAVNLNLVKGMDKVRDVYPEMRSDIATYDNISTAILDALIAENASYTRGNNFIDSRGRAISSCLSKVGNPIGYKDFRASLVIPADKSHALDKGGLRAVYLFIAELVGTGSKNVRAKVLAGKACYENRTYHSIDLATEEGRKELNENIWLERLYEGLDAYNANPSFLWNIPLELDAGASMQQYTGVLLGDSRLCAITNMTGEELSDPWDFEGIPRGQFKAGATPLLYGSAQPVIELWKKAKYGNYTNEQVHSFHKELDSGALGVANALKDFVIRNCNPSATMNVHIHEQQFDIECNRFKVIGERTQGYTIFDNEDGALRRLFHTTTRKVADLEQFRTYFQTLLIHSLDGFVADKVIGKVMDVWGWGIDIHDAFIVHPNAAPLTRATYGVCMEDLFENREAILHNYFRSIGITASARKQWQEVVDKVHPMESFSCSEMALK